MTDFGEGATVQHGTPTGGIASFLSQAIASA